MMLKNAALCGEWVKSRFKQNGRVKKYLHTHRLLAYPTLKNDTSKSIFLEYKQYAFKSCQSFLEP